MNWGLSAYAVTGMSRSLTTFEEVGVVAGVGTDSSSAGLHTRQGSWTSARLECERAWCLRRKEAIQVQLQLAGSGQHTAATGDTAGVCPSNCLSPRHRLSRGILNALACVSIKELLLIFWTVWCSSYCRTALASFADAAFFISSRIEMM